MAWHDRSVKLPVCDLSVCLDLIYFLGLAVLTTYIGAHRGLTSKSRQQMSFREVSIDGNRWTVFILGCSV